jgi:hypothetical protein
LSVGTFFVRRFSCYIPVQPPSAQAVQTPFRFYPQPHRPSKCQQLPAHLLLPGICRSRITLACFPAKLPPDSTPATAPSSCSTKPSSSPSNSTPSRRDYGTPRLSSQHLTRIRRRLQEAPGPTSTRLRTETWQPAGTNATVEYYANC